MYRRDKNGRQIVSVSFNGLNSNRGGGGSRVEGRIVGGPGKGRRVISRGGQNCYLNIRPLSSRLAPSSVDVRAEGSSPAPVDIPIAKRPEFFGNLVTDNETTGGSPTAAGGAAGLSSLARIVQLGIEPQQSVLWHSACPFSRLSRGPSPTRLACRGKGTGTKAANRHFQASNQPRGLGASTIFSTRISL
jgi:hypothetical protein